MLTRLRGSWNLQSICCCQVRLISTNHTKSKSIRPTAKHAWLYVSAAARSICSICRRRVCTAVACHMCFVALLASGWNDRSCGSLRIRGGSSMPTVSRFISNISSRMTKTENFDQFYLVTYDAKHVANTPLPDLPGNIANILWTSRAPFLWEDGLGNDQPFVQKGQMRFSTSNVSACSSSCSSAWLATSCMSKHKMSKESPNVTKKH